MSEKTLINPGHQPGYTCLAFSRDGSRIYTGGSDSLVRIWRTDQDTSQEPDAALEAVEGITSVAAGNNCWLSGSEDAEVRQYAKGKADLEGLVTSAVGVPIRCIAINPQSTRVAVTSDEMTVKVVDLEDPTKMVVLKGHTKGVRRATWHPSGSLLTTCGAEGKIIVWDVSEEEPKEVKTIEGTIPSVADAQSPEFAHDCSAIWHPSGQYFFAATRAHEIVTISKSDWSKSSTYSDDASSGPITALALSRNGIYLASASKSGIFIWSTQNRRMLFRYQGPLGAPITQLAFSPSQNLLAWTDTDGVLTRWPEPIPTTAPDPVKLTGTGGAATVPIRRAGTPTLFDKDADAGGRAHALGADMDIDDDLAVAELDNQDWILDDLDGGMEDDDEAQRWSAKEGIKEMVSVTKAQPAFQPGSTPMDNKKRYLAYNMIGVIEVTDQDTHHIVNVEFHDRSARKSYHFTDHFKYNLASLGERGAVYACQPENDHPAHVIYKPYGTWAAQGEWTYELPKGTSVLGVAAGGAPPTRSLRQKSDIDVQGNGNVVVVTSDNELIFLTGSGIERHCMSLQGDFVSMVAGPEWVFVVHRDGSTTMDGSQNLTGRLIKLDDFCLLQKDSLPVPKGHTLKWIGVTEEGVPAIYDSSGILNALPRFRVPFSATWTRVLNTNQLDRKAGKDESYWPVGLSGDTFMCLILKGRQEHPGFPRPLIQELPLRLPFKRTDPKEAPLEEHLARETMLLDILRDGLGDELTTDDISRRELALDKEIIQLIQNACKNDKIPRAIDLAKLLHHTASFDMAVKVADFYHLVGLREKFEMLKDDREDFDRLAMARDKRRERANDLAPVPAPRVPFAEPSRPKPFQDFRPPPAIARPGLERATPMPSVPGPSRPAASSQVSASTINFDSSFADDSIPIDIDYSTVASPDGKRKRASEERVVEDSNAKRRTLGDARTAAVAQARANPFARKPGPENGRNPFAARVEANKSLHKSESFFTRVDAAEADKIRRPAPVKGKGKEKKEVGRQMTLFGLPPAPVPEKKAPGRKKKAAEASQEGLADKPAPEAYETETQSTDPAIVEQGDTQLDEEPSQAVTEIDADAVGREATGSPEPIDWPPSPPAETNDTLVEVDPA